MVSHYQYIVDVKSKIIKKLKSEENSKVPNHMAKSIDKTNQRNGQQLSYFRLGIGIFKCKKWWIEPGFIIRTICYQRYSED